MIAFSAIAGLDHLASAVMLLDYRLRVQYANPAAETLFDLSNRSAVGHAVVEVLQDAGPLLAAVRQALEENATYVGHDLALAAFIPVPILLSLLLLKRQEV